MVPKRLDEENSNKGVDRQGVNEVSVYIYHTLERGGETGPWDLWHMLVVGWLTIGSYDVIKPILKKAIALLKGAGHRAKGVELLLPFRSQSMVHVTVISDAPPDDPTDAIPSEDQVYDALISVITALKKEGQKSSYVSGELFIRKGSASLEIDRPKRSVPPEVKARAEKARAEKPESLKVKKPQARVKRRKQAKGQVEKASLEDNQEPS